jgi:dolichol-phosphate mannosyltransferase
VQAARLGLRVKEIGVPRVYLDPSRSFGANLDDPAVRLAHYRQVLARADARFPAPVAGGCDLVPECC